MAKRNINIVKQQLSGLACFCKATAGRNFLQPHTILICSLCILVIFFGVKLIDDPGAGNSVVGIVGGSMVGVSMAIAVTFLLRDLPGDLLGDLFTDLPGHLDGNLNGHLHG